MLQKLSLLAVALFICLAGIHSTFETEAAMELQTESSLSFGESAVKETAGEEPTTLARFLWRDANPPASSMPNKSELQWSEQATLDPDQLLARFLWEEEPAKQSAAQQDVTLSMDAQPQLARFLWRDAMPTVLPSGPELQWSEQTPLQATLDPDQLVAGFVWQLRDYDEKQWSEEQDLARFLWDEAPAKQGDTPQATLDPDQLVAGFVWQLRDYDEKQWSEEQDLARFLWDEAPAKQEDTPQLARFLWRDAMPTVLPSGPELQWSEQTPLQAPLDPDQLVAGFVWQLRDYDEKQWSEEQDLARFLWDEAPAKQEDTPQLARFLWRDAMPTVLPSGPELQWSEQAPLQAPLDPDQLVAGFVWQLRDYDEKQWSEEQDLARFLWDEAPAKQEDTPQLARFLWRDAMPTVLPSGPELQWSEQTPLQATLDPDQLVAGFVWQLRDYDEKQWSEEQDLARFLWDEAPAKQGDTPQAALDPDQLVAGFVWQLRDYDEKQWSEEQDLARFLWDEAPAKQEDTPQLARFLWRDAMPTVLPSGPELQWSEQAPLQAPLDPDQLVAGFVWQLRDYDEKQWSEEQDLARFLWDEAPAKQEDTPQLARFLWRDAMPTVLPSGPELQWSEQTPLQAPLDPDQLVAGFVWQLRDYDEKQWSEEQDLARFLWDEAPAKQEDTPQLARFLWRDAMPTVLPSGPELQWSEQTPLQAPLDPDQLVAGFVWQLRDYDEKQWSEEQDLARFLWDEAPAKQGDTPQATLDPDQLVAGFVWQLRDYDEKQWSEEQDLARFLWDEAPAKQEDTPQLARFHWRDAMPTVLPSGPELQIKT